MQLLNQFKQEHWAGALLGRKIARRNALCTWDVNHIGHSDPADLFGGKTPDRAFWNAQIHATSANTDHLWERAISAFVFFYTGGV